MASKRVKRETGDLTPQPHRTDQQNGAVKTPVAAECERLRKEISHKNEVGSLLGED